MMASSKITQPAMILSANQNALGAAKEWQHFLNDN